MMRLGTKKLVAGGAAAVMLLASGCGSGSDANADPAGEVPEDLSLEALIEGAREEGALNVSLASSMHPLLERAFEVFEQEYGITIETTGGRSTEERERILAEQRSDQVTTDVFWAGDTNLRVPEMFAPLGDIPELSGLTGEFTVKDDLFAPTHLMTFGILVRSAVPEDERPTSWQDLTDPKWKDRVVFDDPTAPLSGAGLFQNTYIAFGREYHEALSENAVINRVYVENENAVARGDFDIFVPFLLGRTSLVDQDLTTVVIPSEGVSAGVYYAGIPKGVPHPHAARLFINFIMSEEGQRSIAEAGYTPVRPGLTGLPAGVPSIDDVELIGVTDPFKQEEYLEYADELY